jgi:hypothetical protein
VEHQWCGSTDELLRLLLIGREADDSISGIG